MKGPMRPTFTPPSAHVNIEADGCTTFLFVWCWVMNRVVVVMVVVILRR